MTSRYPDIAYPFPDFQIWSGTVDGAASGLFRDGAQIGSGSAGGSSLTGLTVGALSAADQYGYDYSHVLVAEILFYTGALSPTERSSITEWLNEKYNVIPPPTPPGNTAPPVVSGTARDGATVTATTGSWNGTQPLVYGYQWQRCDSTGASCSDIVGATSPSYTLTSADVGSTVTAVVTASNGFGFASAVALPTAVVASPPAVNTAAPTLSGTPQEGSTLTVTSGKWSGTPPLTLAYQWQRCDVGGLNCVPTPGAAEQSYLLGDSDVGFTIRGVVIASNPGGSVSAASAQTPAIVAARASAPASIEPPVTDGLQLWYEADTERYSDGEAVTAWTDKSGFGRDLTAFAPSQAPVFHRSAVNGRAAVEFDGATSLMKTYDSTFTLPQPTTFFIVYRSLDADTAARAFVFDSRSSSSRQIIGREGASEVRLYADLGLSASGVAYPFPGFQLVERHLQRRGLVPVQKRDRRRDRRPGPREPGRVHARRAQHERRVRIRPVALAGRGDPLLHREPLRGRSPSRHLVAGREVRRDRGGRRLGERLDRPGRRLLCPSGPGGRL